MWSKCVFFLYVPVQTQYILIIFVNWDDAALI